MGSQLTPLILAVAGGAYWDSPTNPDHLRSSEKELVSVYSETSGENFIAIYDLRYITKMQALFGMLTTCIVCFVLMFGSLILTRTTSVLLITPIEIMIQKVQRISKNPLKAAQDEEDEQFAMMEFEDAGISHVKNSEK